MNFTFYARINLLSFSHTMNIFHLLAKLLDSQTLSLYELEYSNSQISSSFLLPLLKFEALHLHPNLELECLLHLICSRVPRSFSRRKILHMKLRYLITFQNWVFSYASQLKYFSKIIIYQLKYDITFIMCINDEINTSVSPTVKIIF